MMGLLILAWPMLGVYLFAWLADLMETWCGTPIWREPSTYVILLFVAPIAGPLMAIPLILEQQERRKP